jgi:hypothetical protein
MQTWLGDKVSMDWWYSYTAVLSEIAEGLLMHAFERVYIQTSQ